MKSDAMTGVLNAVLAIFVLLAALLCFQCVNIARDLRFYTARYGMISEKQPLLNALANDCVEYSKKNSAIDPLLESLGVKPARTGSPAASQSKPATR